MRRSSSACPRRLHLLEHAVARRDVEHGTRHARRPHRARPWRARPRLPPRAPARPSPRAPAVSRSHSACAASHRMRKRPSCSDWAARAASYSRRAVRAVAASVVGGFERAALLGEGEAGALDPRRDGGQARGSGIALGDEFEPGALGAGAAAQHEAREHVARARDERSRRRRASLATRAERRRGRRRCTRASSRPSTPSGAVTTSAAATTPGTSTVATLRAAAMTTSTRPKSLLAECASASMAASPVIGEHGVRERAERGGDRGLEARSDADMLRDETRGCRRAQPPQARSSRPSDRPRGSGRELRAASASRSRSEACSSSPNASICALQCRDPLLGGLVCAVERAVAVLARGRPGLERDELGARAVATLLGLLEGVLLAQQFPVRGSRVSIGPPRRATASPASSRSWRETRADCAAISSSRASSDAFAVASSRRGSAEGLLGLGDTRGEPLGLVPGLAAPRPGLWWCPPPERRPAGPAGRVAGWRGCTSPRSRSCADSSPKATRRATSTASPICACSRRPSRSLASSSCSCSTMRSVLRSDSLRLTSAMAARSSTTSSASRRARASRTIAAIDAASLAISACWPRGLSWRRISPARSLSRVRFACIASSLRSGLLLATPVLEDAGRLLDEPAAVLGARVQHRVELALPDDHVHLAAETGVAQQLLHVEQAALLAVDRVLAAAVAEQRATDRDLAVLDRQRAVGVVDRQQHLGAAERPLGGGAGEDDVLHLAAAQSLGPLLAHDPGEGVDDVGLARTVGADDARDALLEGEGGRLREGLEPLEGQALQVHGAPLHIFGQGYPTLRRRRGRRTVTARSAASCQA